MDPAHSMRDAESARQVRELVAKGALSPGVISTTGCRGNYDKRTARGVQFLQPLAERPTALRRSCGTTRETGFHSAHRRAASPVTASGSPDIAADCRTTLPERAMPTGSARRTSSSVWSRLTVGRHNG